MNDIQQIRSLGELTMQHRRQPDVIYCVQGELLNEVVAELRKGTEARWVISEIVRQGSRERFDAV